jgi:demethylmenaquinone methyltransferase/2-methoxy-6-polyprenyl-1,4-benzoquinol methylase
VSELGADARSRAKLLPRAGEEYEWVDFSPHLVAQRYDRLSGLIPLFEWLFFQPPGFRAKAVDRLDLRLGERVLEIGCGTGRNLPYLSKAVGPHGRVYGVDLSPGMLARARTLCERNHLRNVELIEGDATHYRAPVPLDGVIFGLSYNTMPQHLLVLREAWAQLRPGGRLVIMDAKLPPGLGGRLLLPFSLWLMKHTMLSNPLIKPWEELARLAGSIEMEQFMFGSWYICRAIKI